VNSRDAYGAPLRTAAQQAGISRRALLRFGMSARAQADIDYAGVTAKVREQWEKGTHEPLLRALEPAAKVLAEASEAVAGMRLLDVGAGDGNVALACARRGATVAACDLASAMVARGRARSEQAGEAIAWRRADVQSLPYADGSFDVVVSAFGASLAPETRSAAHELVRVCRPGGRVVLAAWVPRGLPGRMFAFVEALDPLPDGVRSPAAWGVHAVAAERLERLLEDVTVTMRTVPLRFSDSDAMFAALAPVTLGEDQRRALRPGFDRLLASTNNRPPAAEVDARYLVVTGRRPAS